MHTHLISHQFVILALLGLSRITFVHSVIPNTVIQLSSSSSVEIGSIYASVASFGSHSFIPFGKPPVRDADADADADADSTLKSKPLPIKLAPPNNPFLCETPKPSFGSSQEDIIILVPRGGCAFETKTRNAASLGGQHVIIYDNLASKYEYKISTGEVIWPENKVDYECGNGKAWIPMNELSFWFRGYDSSVNDALLTGSVDDGNLCALYHDSELSSKSSSENSLETQEKFEDKCPSQRCLLTSRFDYDLPGEKLVEACCAWDIYITMGGMNNGETNITATHITMEDGDKLVQMVQEAEANGKQDGSRQIFAIVYERWYPPFNLSGFLLFVLGTFVTWIASWKSADSYRMARRTLETTNISGGGGGDAESLAPRRSPPPLPSSSFEMDLNDHHDLSLDIVNEAEQNLPSDSNNNPNHSAGVTTPLPLPSNEIHTFHVASAPSVTNASNIVRELQQESPRSQLNRRSRVQPGEEVVNLRLRHAVLFLIMASSMLLILFITKWYEAVRCVYILGGCASLVHVMIGPGLRFITDRVSALRLLRKPVLVCIPLYTHAVSVVDIIGSLIGITIGAVWLWLSFTRNNVQSHPYYWIIQDLMGVCVCIAFLGVIRLNSIKVGGCLLLAAFIYDVFFVFVTPFIVGESVMITVATGGGSVKDPYHCEKYPSDFDCDNTPLPMLFALPRINDYRGGMGMLGLGDIILPGLLCAFAARLDAAKSLMKIVGVRQQALRRGITDIYQVLPAQRGICKRLFSGYFHQIMIAYAAGLLLANIAVYLMQHGQPALLYLVPFTLCTIVARAHVNGQLTALWIGPRRLTLSDEVVNAISSRGASGVDLQHFRNYEGMNLDHSTTSCESEDDSIVTNEN